MAPDIEKSYSKESTDRWFLWQRNVADKYKNSSNEEIKNDLKENAPPCAVLIQHIEHDFNIGTIIRSANAFGIFNIFYFGKKKFDPRGSVGTKHYMNIEFLSSLEGACTLKNKYSFVALENNINREPVSIGKFHWKPNTMFVIGEEKNGITDDLLDICDDFVEIPIRGSVRSFNAATAASIAFYDYNIKYEKNV